MSSIIKTSLAYILAYLVVLFHVILLIALLRVCWMLRFDKVWLLVVTFLIVELIHWGAKNTHKFVQGVFDLLFHVAFLLLLTTLTLLAVLFAILLSVAITVYLYPLFPTVCACLT